MPDPARPMRARLRDLALVLLLTGAPPGQAADSGSECPTPSVDDSVIHIHSVGEVQSTRENLYRYIWGQSTLPTDDTITLLPDVTSPIGCNVNLAGVDEFHVDMPTAAGETIHGMAWHYTPQMQRRHRLVIVHNGHMAPDGCHDTFADGEDGLNVIASRGYMGLQMTINALLADGYDVLAVEMPNFVEGQCTGDHPYLFSPAAAPAFGSGMRYFLDPTLRSLNYLLSHDAFTDISMTGLSGGGWTTTIYAALDPRIRRSFPVAGSIPLYLRVGARSTAATRMFLDGALPGGRAPDGCPNAGDLEQNIPDMYNIAGYLDLYVLGAYGAGREQVQILNRRDSCCFGQNQHSDPATYDSDLRHYESEVRARVQALGAGEFRLDIDEASTIHQISRDAVHDVILADLAHAHAKVAAASSANLFRRGTNGHLWQYGVNGWRDTGFAISGKPSVLENATHAIDVVARNEVNAPEHLWTDGDEWHSEPLRTSSGSAVLPEGRLVVDPVAQASDAGAFDVVALGLHDATAPGTDFFHWHVTADGQTFEKVADALHAVGPPALAAIEGSANLSVHFRNGEATWTDPYPIPPSATECVEQPRVLYGLARNGTGQWQPEERSATTALLGFPAAVITSGATRLYYATESGGFWEAASSTGSPPWTLTNLATGTPYRYDGTPSQPTIDGGVIALFTRTVDNDLVQFRHDGSWSGVALDLDQGGADAPAAIADSPRAVPGAVYWTGQDGKIRSYDGTGIDLLDVLFRDGFD